MSESQQLNRLLRRAAALKGRHEIVKIVNADQFIELSMNDLTLMVDSIITPQTGSHQILYVRVAVLILAEMMEDIPELLGKDFREALVQSGCEHALMEEFSPIGRAFGQLRREHETDLKKIRNISIAHREKDAEAQIELMEVIDVSNVVRLATELIKWHTSFFRFTTKLLKSLATQVRLKPTNVMDERGKDDG